MTWCQWSESRGGVFRVVDVGVESEGGAVCQLP